MHYRFRRGVRGDGREARVRLPPLPGLQRGGQEEQHPHQHRGDHGHPHQVKQIPLLGKVV